nr:retrovirus-related Pol polyprotein from transposon TNT 1-94 [Tanacetum cinerariifolium]
MRRIVTDFSHAPMNQYSPSPNDKKQWPCSGRYIDTRPNGDALRKCILEGLYQPTTVIILAVPATADSPAVPKQTTVETIFTMSPKNKYHYESEKEAIHLLLTGIRDEIYLIVDACKTAHEMWIAIERLQQGESLTIQDIKTKLFWEFGKFTSHDGESMESYYFRFYKMMNEIIRNNLTVATMQVNVQFLQQLQPKWSRTSLNSKNKNVDTTLRYKNDNQTGQFGNQRTVTVVRARENETRKPKRVKDLTYHKEKMLLCKQAENDLGNDIEPLEQVQNDAEYNVFENMRQHSEQPESTSNTCLVEKDDSNVIPDSPNMCDNDIQTEKNAEDERTEFERYKALNDHTVAYDKLERKLNETPGLLAQKEIDIKEGLKVKAYEILVAKEKNDETVHFGNNQFAPILGYGDLVQGNIIINKVYYVEGLNHNLFLVGQFYDADLEVAFRKSTCFVRDLQGNDLLTGNCGSDLYTIYIQEMTSSTPICFMAKASPTQAWLWHRRLSHLNFDYINLISKKDVVIGLPKLKYIKDQLCSSCEASDYDNSGPILQLQNISFLADISALSQQELDLLFGTLYNKFFTAGTSSVNKSSSPTDNSKQQDTPPTTNNPSSTEPTTLTTNDYAMENNNNQAKDKQFQ